MNNLGYVIGVIGHARSGKSTASQIMLNEFNNLFGPSQIIMLAEPIKKSAACMLDITCEDIELLKAMGVDMHGINIRQLLQDIGKTARSQNDYIFCELADYKIDLNHGNYIISDMRFEIEYSYFKKRYGSRFITVKIVRPELDLSKPMYQDISEREIDQIPANYVIENDGTLEEFKEKVLSLCNNELKFVKEVFYYE